LMLFMENNERLRLGGINSNGVFHISRSRTWNKQNTPRVLGIEWGNVEFLEGARVWEDRFEWCFSPILELQIWKIPLEWKIFGFSKGRERLRVGEEEFRWCFSPVQILEFEINKASIELSRTRWEYFWVFKKTWETEKVSLFL
jgi:hypothetical protein